jgi:hypothetical protein
VTQMLHQQELVEPPPLRRLIVPSSHTAWWGIDPSTQRIALGAVLRLPDGSLDRMARSAPFVALTGAPRLSEIRRVTREFVTGIATCCTWPGIVLVEQPGGSQRNWPLFYAVGVIIEAVHDALVDVTGTSVRVETMPPATWKKLACGRGNIYKPSKAKGRTGEYGVLTWAHENGYEGTSWDECDALGLAEAARRTVALDPR